MRARFDNHYRLTRPDGPDTQRPSIHICYSSRGALARHIVMQRRIVAQRDAQEQCTCGAKAAEKPASPARLPTHAPRP